MRRHLKFHQDKSIKTRKQSHFTSTVFPMIILTSFLYLQLKPITSMISKELHQRSTVAILSIVYIYIYMCAEVTISRR
jgi:hypothetical protein